jgi:hypothetical protein
MRAEKAQLTSVLEFEVEVPLCSSSFLLPLLLLLFFISPVIE